MARHLLTPSPPWGGGGGGGPMLGGAVYVAPTGSLLATNCFFGYNTALLGGALYGDIFYTKPIGPSTSTSDIGLEADYNLHTATEDFITAGSPSPGDFANITTTNCTFLQNTATIAGGAVFVQMHFSSYNSLFLNNSVPADVNNAGGAISGSLRLGTLTLVGNTYEQNFAPKAGAVSVGGGLISFDETYRDNRAADGAAIVFWSERRVQTIARGTFTGNVVTRDAQVQSTDQSNTGSGGAIWSSPGSRMSIINTTFSNNSAQNGGGALRGSAFNVTGCTFTNNSALSNPPFGFIPGGGGAIQMIGDLPASPSGASAVFGSVFVNNTSASSYGGAIQVMYGSAAPSVPPTITISSSRLSGNTAVNGGAIAVQGDLLLQFMDTVCLANSASADGGCLYAASGVRSAQISHCVLAGNTAGHVGGSAFISGANVTMLSTNISSSTATSGGGDGEPSVTSAKWQRLDLYLIPNEAGRVSWFAGSTVPSGWLEANGDVVSRSTYAALFTAIGTTYGAGDGSTTFKIPDLRGEFIRGWDHGKGTDSGRAIGTAQSGAIESHLHTIGFVNRPSRGTPDAPDDISPTSVSGHTTVANSGSTGGSETRPRNIALMACIKY